MSYLNYKTRGNSEPHGKPKVYFCCHPEDFEKYLEEICDEILAKQNCSIWYPKNPNAERSTEFLEDLKQMQLFVVPVSSKLLCTENVALNIEYKFAIKNHIPILPLMQEPGLEALFNKKCENLQFLDKHIIDNTAISYDKKLEKYLSSVLIGDELAEKVRAAFDAYVFLSYRKKDRKYAQKLMTLIHKNDFCRDIAIWYDEFLTPGENFNDAIKEALEKSKLFILTVTPNLINELNYILTTEYPMAKKCGKPLLPVELVPTDRKILSEKCEGIPDCADANNESELSLALLEALQKIAIKENDKTPEHNFFIGLAYLGGIDVEVDYEKALKLITDSAQCGVEAAIEKLVDMYQNGIGVAVNHRMVIHWQLKLVDCIRKKLISSKEVDFDKVMDYINSILFLGVKYYDTNSFDEAMDSYNTILDFCKKFSSFLGANSKLITAACYNNIAVIQASSDNTPEAIISYKKALTLRESLLKKYPAEVAEELLNSYINIAVEYDKAGLLKKALKNADNAITLFKSIEKKIDISILYLARAYVIKGSLYQESNKKLASENYLEALEIHQNLMNYPTPEIKAAYADNCYKLGVLHSMYEDFEKGEDYLIKAVEIYEDLLLLDEENFILPLAKTYYELAILYKDAGSSEQALKISDTAITLCKRAKELGKNDYMTIAEIFKEKGDILKSLHKYKESAAYLETACTYMEKVPVNAQTAISFIYLYNSLGGTYYKLYENQSAQDIYHKAWGLHSQFYKFDKSKQKILGILYYNFSLLCYHNYHAKKEASEMVNKAIKIFSKTPGCYDLLSSAIEFKRKFLGYF